MTKETLEPDSSSTTGLRERVFGSPWVSGLLVLLMLAVVIGGAVFGGYRAGISERNSIAATARADELRLQHALALEDMAAGRYGFAIDRLEYIVSVAPNFPGASELLAQAQAQAAASAVQPTAAPTPTPLAADVTPEELFAEVESVYAAGDWDATVQRVTALRAKFPEFQRVRLDGILFVALRNRGIQHIDNGALELGIFDLQQAEQIGPLDVEAQQYVQWATLYATGTAYWGLNWPRAIEAFETLYLIGPFFKDTTPRLSAAHVAFGDELVLGGDPCGAVLEYEAALRIIESDTVAEKKAAAENTCAEGTPTPEGDGTPTPEGDVTPGAETTLPAAVETATPEG